MNKTQLENPYGVARASVERGRALLVTQSANLAEAELRRAQTIFLRMGASREAERAAKIQQEMPRSAPDLTSR